MLRLAAPRDGSRVLIARVEYTVNPRAKAAEHHIGFDVSVPLVATRGRPIQDVGVVRTPIRVDTHLETKLLPKFGLLELTPISLALVIGGVAYLATIGRGMLSKLSQNERAPSFRRWPAPRKWSFPRAHV